MGREEDQLGPVEFFKGAMGAVVTRKVKVLKIIENAVFATLTMQFPNTPASAGAGAATAPTYPAFFELRDVASFQLTSGAIQVIYSYQAPL